MTIESIQRRLKDGGFYSGAIDGDFGPLSFAAYVAHRSRNGQGIPAWMTIAGKELGQREIMGDPDNPRIVEYHSHTGYGATDDEVAWCSSFVSFCLEKAGEKSTHSAAAISYRTYGKHVMHQFGAINVFSRTGGNHVTFEIEHDPGSGSMLCLGGNQSDKVCAQIYGPGRLIETRWPLSK